VQLMKCPICMEEIPDDSSRCELCCSELVIPCPFCREPVKSGAIKCKHCGSLLDSNPESQQSSVAPQQTPNQISHQANVTQQVQASYCDIPEGVAGWSWGAFFLSFIWAAGNKVWIGLIGLLPTILIALMVTVGSHSMLSYYLAKSNLAINILMMFLLGFKGREWAWKNGNWRDIDHFNSVQRKWSLAGYVFFAIGIIGVLFSVAMPQFRVYRIKGFNTLAMSDAKNAKTTIEAYFADHQRYPESLESAKFKSSGKVEIKCTMLSDAYVCGAAHKNGTVLYVVDNMETNISEFLHESGSPIQLPYSPQSKGSAKADSNNDTSIVKLSGNIEWCRQLPGNYCLYTMDGKEVLVASGSELEGTPLEATLQQLITTPRSVDVTGVLGKKNGMIAFMDLKDVM
jgi:type II secretory pathway pseudopilin PulG